MTDASHNPGDVVWLDHEGKQRPAVVLVVHPDGVSMVFYGSRTQRSNGRLVSEKSREGKALQIDEPTYFTPGQVVIVQDQAALTTRRGSCPPGFFLELRQLAGIL